MEALKIFPQLFMGLIVFLFVIFSFESSITTNYFKDDLIIIDAVFLLLLIINLPVGLTKAYILLCYTY